MPSAFDSESTYTMAKSSRDEEKPDSPPPAEPQEPEVPGEVEQVAVAYFVEASGKIVPVDILPEHQPVSQMGSVFEFAGQHKEEAESPRYPLWEPQPGEEDEVVVEEDASPEELFERALGNGSIHSASTDEELAEQEAVVADLAPEWMQEREEESR